MPTLVRQTPKYRRHKASGQAVVTLDGRDHYLGRYGSARSKAEFKRLVGEWLTGQYRPPKAKVDDDVTVAELAAAYWKFAKGYYVKDGKPTCIRAVKVALGFMRESYGHTAVADFGPLALAAIQQRMIEANHARTYINDNIGRIRHCFKWGVAQQMVPVTVYQALCAVSGLRRGKTIARETVPVGPVPAELVQTTMRFLPPVVADMVRFQQLVGCRPGEVCSLRPCDVDTKGEVWCYVPESHKTEHHGRQRRIYIGPQAQAILRPYLLRDHQAYCFSPLEARRRRFREIRAQRKTPVQPSQLNRSKRYPKCAPGDCYTKDSYNRAIRRACDRADRQAHKDAPNEPKEKRLVPHWHPNQLRHAVATRIREQFGLEAAQTVLGHSRADVTQVYAERDFGLAQRVMREVG